MFLDLGLPEDATALQEGHISRAHGKQLLVRLRDYGVNARTIVNEVTGTAPSLIQGQIAVAGPRANVVLANPNGITVNGGTFVNTGHVALSTGQVSFSDVLVAPGVYQRNVVLDTGRGTIEVAGGGLAGTLIGLELIAKMVRVTGRNESPAFSAL